MTYQNIKIGLLICEDGWANDEEFLYEQDPVTDLSAEKLDIILSINGSPSNVGKQLERLQHFSVIAQRCHAPLAFINQVGGNDDIVFDGASFLLDSEGQTVGTLASFEEAIGFFTLEHKKIMPSAPFNITAPLSNIALLYGQIILGIKDYVIKCGFQKVVIGLSGGVDSALTLALAVQALGSEKVTAISMPSRYSSLHSITDAQALCDYLQVKLIVASIEPEFIAATEEFEKVFAEKPTSLTLQNIQARIRGRILMSYSNQTGALVLSTGNKSELSVGYTTLYGDMTGGLNPIGDLYKTEVYALCEYFNDMHPHTPIPRSILEKAPSAELDYDQKDSDSLPDYAILDPILQCYIEGDLLPKQELMALYAFLENIPTTLIQQVHNMVNKAEFKRRQAPPIIRVQRRAFGSGRQLPIAANYP